MSAYFMPVLDVQMGSASATSYYISNNSPTTYAWDAFCQQGPPLSDKTSPPPCSDSPVLANDAFDGTDFTIVTGFGTTDSGYTTEGNTYLGNMTIVSTAGNSTSAVVNVNDVLVVNTDTWLNSVSAQFGYLGFGFGSDWITAQGNEWSIELGNIANQTFTNSTYVETTPNLFIGSGDYSTIFTADSNNSVTVQSLTASNNYGLSGAWFGLNSTGIYYSNLGYSLSSSSVTIALNFQGIGLPYYEWAQLINLMGLINAQIAQDLTCSTISCTLSQPCGTAAYADLWTYTLMLQFSGATNYVTVNIGSIAIENLSTGQCDLYLQQNEDFVLGSLWFQNFIGYFNSDFLSLQVSAFNLTGALIGPNAPVNTMASPFTVLPEPLSFQITEDGFSASIQANFGFQGLNQFLLSTTSSIFQAYSTDCRTPGLGGKSCDVAPNYAINYFDLKNGTEIEALNNTQDDGYSTQGFLLNQTICFNSVQMPASGILCTPSNQLFYVANTLVSNNWNYQSKSYAGILGLGISSPFWALANPLNQADYYYQILMSNVTSESLLVLGTLPNISSQPNITVKPTTSRSQLFTLTEFGFGTADQVQSTASYMTIINGDAALYGIYTNTTKITPDFRGIGLPTTSFNKFVNLLAIATQGSSSCDKTQGGYCVLPGQCSNYSYLQNYSFYISLAGDSNYMIVPLVSFAYDQFSGNSTVNRTDCSIYVEMLDESLADSLQIVLGVGFLRSFNFLQYASNSTVLTVNPNSTFVDLTYLGSQTLTQGPNIFAVTPVTATVVETEINQPVLVQTSFSGVPTNQTNFMLDLSNSMSVVWNANCIQKVEGSGSCSQAPTYLNTNFTTTETIDSTFTNVSFGGYLTSGNVYIAQMNQNLNLSTTTQSLRKVYSASTVYEDAWLLDQQIPAVGTLGYGLDSSFWYQFTDPVTYAATYSVALGNNGSASNITFGAGSTVGFESATPLNLNASYAIQQLGFGEVYQTNGVDTSSYFYNFTTNQNALFTLNFIGLGLPQSVWSQFTPLLQNITNNQTNCSSGICTLPGSCSAYNLQAFSFQVMFNSSSVYMNVPLSAFEYNNVATCDIYVQALNTTLTQSNNIIFGSMFFRNFYGIWTNQYNVTGVDAEVTQNLTLYVNAVNTSAYIGSQMLPQGENPFFTPIYFKNFTVSINSTSMTASIMASIGSGQLTPFMVSFTESLTQTYATNCTTSTGTGNSSCSAKPNFCNNYFNMSNQIALEGLNVTYDGYVTQGYLYNESLCLNATVGLQCTATTIYAADVLQSNDWNYGSPATAGIIGLAAASPVWQNETQYQQSIYGYWVQLSNFTDWSFVQAPAPKSRGNYILLGTYNDTTYSSAANISVKSTTSKTQLYGLNSFEFGVTNFTNMSSSYQSIINANSSGIYANSTKVTLGTSGIGLPTTSFNQFANLLEIVSAGQVNCIKQQGGFCILPQNCSSYPTIWNFSFRMQFTGADNILIVPLASFAADMIIENIAQCKIFVEMLDANFEDSQQIVMGTMFFQSIVMNQQLGPGAQQLMTLAVNINALPNTYIGNDTFQEQADAFSIVQDQLALFTPQNNFYFPTILITNPHIPSLQESYFMLDFSNDLTVVWDSNCAQNLTSSKKNQACSLQPVAVVDYYANSNPVQTYTNIAFGGYLTSGKVYIDTICVAENCKEMLLYDATFISQDNWLYNQGVSSNILSYGILGFGPNSPLWNQYIDPTTGIAAYSISLNQTLATSGNITLGGVINNTNSSVSMVSDSQALYNLTTIGFGIVYQTNGVDSSSYFSNLTTAPVQFSTNYQGLGLPAETWVGWADLMANLTNNDFSACQNYNGSSCLLTSPCSSYDWITSFSFQMIFEGSSNYMRVPLSTFSVSTSTSCSLYVNLLYPNQTQSSNIIMGYQYFEDFQGNFYNQYSLDSFVNQTANLFIQPTFKSNVAYIGNELLPQGKTPFDSAPSLYQSAIGSNYQVTVNASFGGLPWVNYQMDNNAGFSYAWTTICQQSSALANRTTDLDCSNAPSYVTESLNQDLVNGGGPYSSTVAGGYTTSGNNLRNTLSMYAANAQNATTTSLNMHAVEQITGNSWQMNDPTSSGAIAFGGDSQWVSSLSDPTTLLSIWSIELGNLANQSFTGASYSANSSRLYMGPGNYTKLYEFTSNDSISLYTNKNNNYDIAGAWLGSANTTSAYFLQLGYDMSSLEVVIALNFPGLGLPWYEYQQFINLLYRINSNITTDLTCDVTTTTATGICQLANSCFSNRYTELWTYQFKIRFDIATNNYTTVGIGSFAIDGGDVCNLYIQLLEPGTAQSTNLVLGSMWLQNFVALFIVDFSGVTNTDQLNLQVSKYALPLAALNTVGPTQTAVNAFDYLPSTLSINVNVSPKMVATVTANLGYQGDAEFLVSLSGNYVQAYSTTCRTVGLGSKSCDVAPNFATNYFNESNAIPQDSVNSTAYDGYSTQGQFYNQSVCLTAANFEMFCSVNSQAFYVASTLVSNDWNYESSSAAGIFGFGVQSPVWNMTNLNKTDAQTLSVQFQNVTDWSFYLPNYTPIITGNQIILGKPQSIVYAGRTNITIKAATQNGQLLNLTQFMFGTYSSSTQQESMTSIINDGNYGIYTNMTQIALDFRGIGLPTTQYTKFVNLIGIATQGAANCLKTQGGYCVLPQQCKNYQDLWTSYAFKIVFSDNTNYLIVPLASFAAEATISGHVGCAIYVEMLDESLSDSQQIVLGQMFFQTVAYTSTGGQSTSETITLSLNLNAMTGAYLGSQVVTETTSAFAITPTQAPVYTAVQQIGLPSFTASIQGYPESVTPNFLIDFQNDHTVVWDSTCQQTVTEPYGPCSLAPTFLMTNFTNATQIIGTFSNKEFGGFLCSGNIVATSICISGTCRLMTVYAATQIIQDSWIYGQSSAYGILGYGSGSPIWNQYIDLSGVAQFSVSLAQTSRSVQNAIVQSNVTFGSQGNIQDYAAEPSLIISTSTSSYPVTEFGFGKVYASNGISASSYFYNMTTNHSVIMSTNFQGLGLPTDLYQNYTVLLNNVTGINATCLPIADGYCVIQGSCSAALSILGSFSFQIMFESNSTQYMRVPLSAFGIQTTEGCKIAVSNLSPELQLSSNIVLGGMFFEEFFGAATNQYNSTTAEIQTQTMTLFVQLNSNLTASYIGDELLPLGDNPFYTAPSPVKPNDTASIVWIVILCVVISLLAGFLAWAIWKWRKTSQETNDKRYIVYNTDDRKEPLSSTNNFVSDSEL